MAHGPLTRTKTRVQVPQGPPNRLMSDRSTAVRDAIEPTDSANQAVDEQGAAGSTGPHESKGPDAGRRSRPRQNGSLKRGWFGGDERQSIAFYGEFYR